MVTELIIKGNVVKGVKTGMGIKFISKTVILTNGTFLNGTIHIGESSSAAGRTGERAAVGLTENLVSLGLKVVE